MNKRGDQAWTRPLSPARREILEGLIKSSPRKRLELRIVWSENGQDSDAVIYIFDNADKLAGFLDGLEAATGWLWGRIIAPIELSGDIGI